MENNKNNVKLSLAFGRMPFIQAIRLIPKRMPLINLACFKRKDIFLVKDYNDITLSDVHKIFNIISKQSEEPYHPKRDIKTYIHFYFKDFSMNKIADLITPLKRCSIIVEAKEWADNSNKSNLLLKNSDLDYDICLMIPRNLSRKEFRTILKLMK